MLSCRAAILNAVGSLEIGTIDLAPLKPGDVLVKIEASSLCHTDLEVLDGQLPYPMPIVLGHEAAGRIVDIGADVGRSRIGEHVILSWNPHCGHCLHCEAGSPILCDDYLREGPRGHQLDGTSRLSRNGAPVATMFFIAGFAEYVVVSSHCAIAVIPDIPSDLACLIGCAVMTGVGASVRTASVAPGENVVVIGCGAVGLAAIQGARMAGAATISAIDLDPGKRDLAEAAGATHFFVPVQACDGVRSLARRGGADVVIECAGHPDAFRLSVEICRPGGRVVWLGKVKADQEVAFRWGSLMGEKQIIRSSYGGARPQSDFPMLAEAWVDGRLKLEELVTRRIGLDDINSGFDDLRSGRAIRTVICFP